MKHPRWSYVIIVCLLTGLFLVGCATLSQADKDYEAGNLKAAFDEYERTLSKASQSKKKQINERIVDIRNRITRGSIAEAERLSVPGTIPALRAASELLKSELRYDNAAQHGQKKLDEISARLAFLTTKHQSALNAAAAAEAADQWTVAYENLSSATQLNPSDELSSRIRGLITRRDAKVPLDIQQNVSQENLEAAERALSQYLAERPRPASNLTDPLENAVGALRKRMLETRLDKLLAAKNYYTAYHLVLASKRDYLEKRLAEIRTEGAQYYLEKARRELRSGTGRIGYAYFAAEKAWELLDKADGDNSELNNAIFVTRREASDTLDALIRHQIAVITFSSPSVESQGGVALANALVQNLTENVPYGIEILERQKLENIKEETGTLGAKVRMFIVGDLTTLNVERKHSEREGTVSAVKGKRSVPNPAYNEYLRRFGSQLSKWPDELKGTPTTILEDETELVKYKLGQETLNGVMVASVRAFESAVLQVKWAKDFKAEHNKTDSFSDPVSIAVPPIALDPLELPTDNEVKELLRKDLAQQIGAEVLKSFEHREQRYLSSAKASLLRREMPQAVADLAGGHYYAYKDVRAIPDPLNNPTVAELRQLGFFDCTENP